MYNDIMSAHNKAAKASVPVKAKVKQRIPWEDENITAKRESVKKAHEKGLKRRTRRSVANLEEAKKDLLEAYDQEQEKYVNKRIHAIASAMQYQKSGLAWETVNELTGRKGTNKGRIRANSPEERINRWTNHFSNLFRPTTQN